MVTEADGIAREERQSEITNEHHHFPSAPQIGDVLASRPTARTDAYTISILPAASHLRVGSGIPPMPPTTIAG